MNHYKDWAVNFFPNLKRNLDLVEDPMPCATPEPESESQISNENLFESQSDPITPPPPNPNEYVW